jgi:rhodanese-related sulfurtransferase
MNKFGYCLILMLSPIACTAAESSLAQESSAPTAPAMIEQQANESMPRKEKPCAQMTKPTNELQGNTDKSAQPTDEQIKSLSGELFAKGTKPRQQSCYLEPAKAAELWQQGNATFIDIRTPAEFERYRIRNSLNMTPAAIKTKAFLKTKTIVLVGTGYAGSELESLCTGLRAAGFTQVAILDGGLNAWRQQVGTLDGDPLAQFTLNRITPELFFREREYNHWAVLDLAEWVATGVGEERQQRLQQWLATKRQQQAPAANYFLITSNIGDDYTEIEHAVQALGWINVFYLEGGKQAYSAFLKRQWALWNRTPGKQGAVTRCGG